MPAPRSCRPMVSTSTSTECGESGATYSNSRLRTWHAIAFRRMVSFRRPASSGCRDHSLHQAYGPAGIVAVAIGADFLGVLGRDRGSADQHFHAIAHPGTLESVNGGAHGWH